MSQEKKEKKKKEKTQKREKGTLKADLWMFRKLWHYSPGYVLTNLLYGVVMGVLPSMNILYTERLYNAIGDGNLFTHILWLMVAYFAAVLVLRGFHTVYQLVLLPRFRETINRKLYTDILTHANRTDLANYDNPAFFNEFIFSMQNAWPHTIELMEGTANLISHFVTLTLSTGIIWRIDPLVAILIFASGFIRVWLMKFYNRLDKQEEEEVVPERHHESYIKRVFTTPDYAKELRISHVSDNLLDDYDACVETFKATKVKYGKKYLGLDVLFFITGDVLNYGILLILLWQLMMVPDSGVTLGGFAVGVNALWNLSWRIQSLGDLLMAYHRHGIFVKKIIEFFGIQPTVVGQGAPAPTFDSLTIENLSFSYPQPTVPTGEAATDAEDAAADRQTELPPVLENVNLTVKRGEKIAIVGYNGAGKTTLTKLIMRLYDPTDGHIRYNGQDLSTFDLDSLRGRVAAVFQDYRIFAATIAENVVGGELSDGKAGEEQRRRVLEALRKSTFSDKLATLEQGVDTVLTREFSDEGTQLSGGEAQKIAIARAFYKDADLIILDEPSSALDPNAEYELNRAIYDYAEDKTVIFISHRLSTTRHANRIYMFDGGQIIESGTHDELMALNGKYAYMFNLQAEKYRLGEDVG